MLGGTIDIVIPALGGAVLAALCYGTATVLQAVGVRRLAGAPAGARLSARLARATPYAAGLALDGAGFLASLAAFHSLPLFVVESVVASSVAVTALLSVAFLGARLRGPEVVGLVVVAAGLVALAVSATSGPADALAGGLAWWPLAGVALVGLVAAPVLLGDRRSARPGPAAPLTSGAAVVLLAVAAGLGFSGVGVAARVLALPHPWWRLVADPVAWALVAYAALSMLFYALALVHGSVTVVAALTFGVETVVPATIGLLWLGDRVRPGFAVVALAGFVATVAGCVALAGKAEVVER